jgi:MFS family permease
VAAGFLIQLVLWGGLYSFGVFRMPMSDDQGESRARIAAVYTVVALVFGLGSVIWGNLTDRWGPRQVVTMCSLLAATGYALIFFVSQSWHA